MRRIITTSLLGALLALPHLACSPDEPPPRELSADEIREVVRAELEARREAEAEAKPSLEPEAQPDEPTLVQAADRRQRDELKRAPVAQPPQDRSVAPSAGAPRPAAPAASSAGTLSTSELHRKRAHNQLQLQQRLRQHGGAAAPADIREHAHYKADASFRSFVDGLLAKGYGVQAADGGYQLTVGAQPPRAGNGGATSGEQQAADSYEKSMLLRGFNAETVLGRHVDYGRYVGAVIPWYSGANRGKLTPQTRHVGSKFDTEVTFAVFGRMERVVFTHFQYMGDSGTREEIGTLENTLVTIKSTFPADASTVRVTGIVMGGEGHENEVAFGLDTARDHSEYSPILISF